MSAACALLVRNINCRAPSREFTAPFVPNTSSFARGVVVPMPMLPLGAVLASLGVAITTAVVACVAHFALGFNWQLAVLIGAVTSPTDSAAPPP